MAYGINGIRQNFADVGLGLDLAPSKAKGGIHLRQEIDLPVAVTVQ